MPWERSVSIVRLRSSVNNGLPPPVVPIGVVKLILEERGNAPNHMYGDAPTTPSDRFACKRSSPSPSIPGQRVRRYALTIRRTCDLKPGSWHADIGHMNDSVLDVTGVGPATARLLAEADFTSVESLANAEPKALAMVQGIGPVRAASLRTAAQRLLAGSEPVSTAVASGGPTKRKERAKRAKKAQRLRKQAKQLRKQARQLTKKAESTKSKKKRKRRLREAAKLEAAAKRARQKSKKLLAK